MKHNTHILIVILLAAVNVCFAGKLPPGFVEIEMANELDPTDFAVASDGRIFIVEKKGVIQLIRDGKLLDQPFMELEVDNTNERGLQSIELDPNFESNNYFYVFYSVPVRNFNRISRFTANGDRVLAGSELVLYETDPNLGTVHNGGGMIITPDEKLIFTTGDGNATWRSQWSGETHGKIFRINLDGSIPDDNPKKYGGGKYEAIIARGARNPFGIAQSQSGQIFINDVGGNDWEEINELEVGANYGWPFAEGKHDDPNAPMDYRDPVYAYDHDFGCAIVGGVFVPENHPTWPQEYKGKYLFSDYCKGWIKIFDVEGKTVQGDFATEIDRPLRMNFDEAGNLYYLERAGLGGGTVGDNTQSKEGRLMMVIYTGDGKPLVSRQPRNQRLSIGETAVFTCSANGADPLTYDWFVDGSEVQSGTSDSLLISNVQLSQNGAQIHCIVKNSEGADTSDFAELQVTNNKRPSATIELLSESLYIAGRELIVKGIGMDAEDGSLSPDQMVWTIDFHHDLHTHPALAATTSTDQITYSIPSVGEIDDNVWYRVYLSVTDSEGLVARTFLDVFPQKSTMSLRSSPDSIDFNVDGLMIPTPAEVQTVVGLERNITAPLFVFRDEHALVFDGWSNGQLNHDRSFIASDQNESFEAKYVEWPYGMGNGLIGTYYDMVDRIPEFPDSSVFTRIDSMIDFQWEKSPDSIRLGEKRWLIRWEGYVQPIITGNHKFGFNTRSGVRMWVDRTLIMEDWQDNPTTFFESEEIWLEGGRQYPIFIEYFTFAEYGTAQLYWATDTMPISKIPMSQLFAQKVPTHDSNQHINVVAIPNPTNGQLNVVVQGQLGELNVRLVNLLGQEIYIKDVKSTSDFLRLPIDISTHPSGLYNVIVENQNGQTAVQKVIKSP